MNHRQCMVAALTHQEPARVPCEVRLTIDMQAQMIAYTGDKDFIGRYIPP
jgi:hypothetical protein